MNTIDWNLASVFWEGVSLTSIFEYLPLFSFSNFNNTMNELDNIDDGLVDPFVTRITECDAADTRAIEAKDVHQMIKKFDQVTEILTNIADSFNSCSTGLCLLTMTIERFIFICHPTEAETLLSKSRHMTLCGSALLLILLGSSMNYLQRSLQNELFYRLQRFALVAILKVFDVIVFLIIPTAVCVFLFIKIAVALKSMMPNVDRNKQLIRALATSYFFWIILWSPNIIFDTVATFNYFSWFENSVRIHLGVYLPQAKRHINFWRSLLGGLRLLYSAVIPVVFVILLQALQEPLIRLFSWMNKKVRCRRQ